uniref:Protein AF1q n=1 Tax=Esox lucius TaxID=8010 RepID=A0AAY5JX88_ESOLU
MSSAKQRMERIKMLVKSNSEYDSFLYWRQPISAPDLSELEDLGLLNAKPTKKSKKAAKKQNAAQAKQRKQQEAKEAELLEYTTFNYWREPIPSIDLLDFNLLL